MKKINIIVIAFVFLISCSKIEKSDAYGNFEAVEVIVSSESNGKLINFEIEEGQKLKQQQLVGVIDSVGLYLKLQQTKASKATIKTKFPNVFSQIEVLKEQKASLLKDQKRFKKLFKEGAATQKQIDDIDGTIKVIDKKILSSKTQNNTIYSEIETYNWKIKRIEEQLSKCKISNPVSGLVLNKYAEEGEFLSIGKPIYKIANLDEIILRVYISGSQLGQIKIGQNVNVLADKNSSENQSYEGRIIWISNQAEFTPKIIQTKEERVKLVYAVKIKVKNNGSLKIGMPGEVNF
jgi:HlyD family secretion protein